MAVKARAASRQLQALDTADRVAILNRIADSLVEHEAEVLAENAKDVEAATGNINDSLLQRLILKPKKIEQLAGGWAAGRKGQQGGRLACVWCRCQRECSSQRTEAGAGGFVPTSFSYSHGAAHHCVVPHADAASPPSPRAAAAATADGIRAIAQQEEPIGRLLSRVEVAEGLVLDKVSSPIGVLLIIFEARPDALPQIASLAIRSGNGLLLKVGPRGRGGEEGGEGSGLLLTVRQRGRGGGEGEKTAACCSW